MAERHEKKFQRTTPNLPVYKPGDKRIDETLRKGGGVGVDLSGLSPDRRAKAMSDLNLLYGQSHAPRVDDVVYLANQQMLSDNEKYPQEDEDDSPSENS